MRAFVLVVVGARDLRTASPLRCYCTRVVVASIARRGAAALRSASSVWRVALDVAGSVNAEVAQAVAQGPVQIRRACISCKSSLAAAQLTPAHELCSWVPQVFCASRVFIKNASPSQQRRSCYRFGSLRYVCHCCHRLIRLAIAAECSALSCCVQPSSIGDDARRLACISAGRSGAWPRASAPQPWTRSAPRQVDAR